MITLPECGRAWDRVDECEECGVTPSEQWAVWFRNSADEAEDLTEGQREGFRIAAEHLESPRVQALVAEIVGGVEGGVA